MNRIWFSQELETVATFWRVARRDGVTLGLTTHDGDLWFDGVLHRAGPGMVPSAVRRSADLEPDSADVEGALSHGSISEADLAAGRFDGATVVIGLVDWQTLDRFVLYRGSMGMVSEESGRFSASIVSRKAELQRDPVPRTSPTCRATFCGPGCNLSAARFTHLACVTDTDETTNTISTDVAVNPELLAGGEVRWLDGPNAATRQIISRLSSGRLALATPLTGDTGNQRRVELREGCDRTITTCATRFGNVINFQGEPYLPGNDLIARSPAAA